MTSVLYSSGLNYQLGNPIRSELNNLRTSVAELRKAVESFSVELQNLKNDVRNLSKVATSNRTSISTLSSQISQLQSALTTVASQGNFTVPTLTPSAVATTATSVTVSTSVPVSNVLDNEEYESEEEVVNMPAPVVNQRMRRRRGAE